MSNVTSLGKPSLIFFSLGRNNYTVYRKHQVDTAHTSQNVSVSRVTIPTGMQALCGPLMLSFIIPTFNSTRYTVDNR